MDLTTDLTTGPLFSHQMHKKVRDPEASQVEATRCQLSKKAAQKK